MPVNKKQFFIVAILLFICYISLMSKWGQEDMNIWMSWVRYMYGHGITHIYETDCNYLPVGLGFLWLHNKIQHTYQNIQDNLYMIKVFPLMCDFLCAYLAVWFIKNEQQKYFFFFVTVFNVAFIYNSAIWGQVDSMYTLFGFASIILALEKKPVWSAFMLVVALNLKLQALIFIPLVGLLLLPQFLKKDGFKKIMLFVIIACVFQFIVFLPFILAGTVSGVFSVIHGVIGRYPSVSVAAFNIWHLITPLTFDKMFVVNDNDTFFLLSYKNIGYLMYFISVFFAIFPLMRYMYQKYMQDKTGLVFPLEKIFLISALMSLDFFYFNAEMHERYAHACLVSLAAYAYCTSSYFPFIIGSIAYVLNLEKIMRYFALTNYGTLIFNPKFVAVLFLILIIYLYNKLYSSPSQTINYIQPEI